MDNVFIVHYQLSIIHFSKLSTAVDSSLTAVSLHVIFSPVLVCNRFNLCVCTFRRVVFINSPPATRTRATH